MLWSPTEALESRRGHPGIPFFAPLSQENGSVGLAVWRRLATFEASNRFPRARGRSSIGDQSSSIELSGSSQQIVLLVDHHDLIVLNR
jgi:hypothetical protein